MAVGWGVLVGSADENPADIFARHIECRAGGKQRFAVAGMKMKKDKQQRQKPCDDPGHKSPQSLARDGRSKSGFSIFNGPAPDS
jgi:hypothetical protein